ncbi:MAG: response regulator [Oligoflexales bacterium]|nr:response regulator [Oligoflexales bacterium]
MKLQTKMLLTLVVTISVLTGIENYIEVLWQVAENEHIESEFQSIQVANAISTFEYALWNLDSNAANAGLIGLFQSASVLRAQLVTKGAEVFSGFKAELGRGKSDGHMETAAPVADRQLAVEADAVKSPVRLHSEKPFEKLVFTDIGGDRRRIAAALWFNKPGVTNKPAFMGHLVVDYSLENAHARARMTILRHVVSYALMGMLLTLLLFCMTKYQVVSPLRKLESVSQIIAGGDFSGEIALSSRDEIGSLGRSLEKMRLELKQFKEKLQDKIKQLEAANTRLQDMDQQKTSFFQNVSHELRTPLTLIVNSLEMAEKAHPGDPGLRLAASNSMKLFRLVNQLLDFQKLSAGRKEIKLAPVRVADFLEVCAAYFLPMCIEQKISFYYVFNNYDPIILAQVDALEKIIFNYLSNALKYTRTGGLIEAGLEVRGDKVLIFVKDDGPGISDEEKPRLFKIFSQVGDTGKRRSESTGIGLALVKELTEAMNGRVFCESTLGRGSVFGVEFPLHRSQKPIYDILVAVEDSLIMLDMEEYFKKEGLKVHLTDRIQRFHEFLKRYDYHCILIDLKIGGKDELAGIFTRISGSLPSARRLVMGDDGNEVDGFLADSGWLTDKKYIRPVNLEELSKDVKNFVKTSPIVKEDVVEVLSFENPKKWHVPKKEVQMSDEVDDVDDVRREGDGRLILVVDDVMDMRILLKQILNEWRYSVITARGGIEGLDKAASHKPDLIIVDWMMPDISGPEMIERMLADRELRGIPTILLTARGDEDSRKEGIEMGATAYLSKPFDEIELSSMVENLIHLKEGEEKIRQLNRNLTENILKRFLPHKLVNDIVSGEKILDDKPRLMNITILFSDLVDFTDKAEDLGPQFISPILNDYFSRMTEVVFNFGGTVDKFIGDGIMVIFGAPEEEKTMVQVQNAIECARAMQRELGDLNREWKEIYNAEFSMRVGIHHGSCIVGSFGSVKRSEYTAIGPAVNMASRIQRAAEPGGIFFSASVRDNLSSDGWSRAGSYDLRGIGETTLYRLKLPEGEEAA